MVTWAKKTAEVIDKGFGGSRGGKNIEGAVIHHGAGTSVLTYVANWNDRDSHPTYHIGTSGRVTGIVNPNRRPFSTGGSVDSVAITFEVDNSSYGGNWPVSDAAIRSVIEVCVDHARQAGLKKVAKNTPGRDQPGVFFIAWHSQYIATACPGPYLLSKMDYIISECNRILSGGSTQPSPPDTPPSSSKPSGSLERAYGGISGAPLWPRGELMKKIQSELKKRGRYTGLVDGLGGRETAKGIQKTIARGAGYTGPIDGLLGPVAARKIQEYAKKYGDYFGPIDSDPREKSWQGFLLGLERP